MATVITKTNLRVGCICHLYVQYWKWIGLLNQLSFILKGNDFLYSMVYKNILFSEVLNLKGEKFLNFDNDTFVTLLLKLSFRVKMSQDSEKATRVIYKEKREGHSSGLLWAAVRKYRCPWWGTLSRCLSTYSLLAAWCPGPGARASRAPWASPAAARWPGGSLGPGLGLGLGAPGGGAGGGRAPARARDGGRPGDADTWNTDRVCKNSV